jgi:hypothetical protein
MASLQMLDHLANDCEAVLVGIAGRDHLGALDPILELEVDGAPHLGPVRIEIGEHDAEVRPIRLNDQILGHPSLLPSSPTLRDGAEPQQGQKTWIPWATLGPCPDEMPEVTGTGS